MQVSRVSRALVQPGVRCLLGAATESVPLSVESRTSWLSSIERTAGVASPSGFSAIFGSYAGRSAFSSKASLRAASKERRRSAAGKNEEEQEENAGLIRVVLRKDLKGLGRQGHVVQVKRGRMRHELYPSGEAAYATPENIAKYALSDAEKQARDSGSQEGVLEKLLRALTRRSVVADADAVGPCSLGIARGRPRSSWKHHRLLTRRASVEDPERFVGPTVSPESIRKAVLRQLGIQLDASHFLSEAEIKTYGTFKVPLNLRLPEPDDQQIELTVHVDRRGKDAAAAAAAAAAGGGAPAAAATAGRAA